MRALYAHFARAIQLQLDFMVIRMRTTIYSLIALSLSALNLGAQTSTTSVTISQAVQMGIANSSMIKMDSLKLEQAKSKQTLINDAALPSASLNAGYSRLSPVDPLLITFPGNPEPVALFPVILNNYTVRASVSQTVFTGWKLKYTQESYNYLTQAAALDQTKDQNEIKYTIMAAYVSHVKLQLSREILEANLQAAKQRVVDVTNMRDKGTATDNDVLKAQLYQSNLELSLSDMDNTIAVSEFNLCIMLGLPQGTTIVTDTTGLFAAVSLLPEQSYETDALNFRAEKKAADARWSAAETNMKIAQSAYYPTVAVGANYLFARPNQRIIPYVDEFRGTWDVGVSLSWSVTSVFTAKHSVHDAEIQAQQIETQSGALDNSIRMEVFQNYAACKSAVDKIKILELSVIQAQENSRQVKAKFDQQMAMMSEVLDADALLLQAQINLTLQRADQTVSYYRLQKSTGTL